MDPRCRPIVYACSGCSSVAQLANDLAVRLDREGEVEMSCVSGVGGGVGLLVKLARSGRPVLALDGCALACSKACLSNVGVTPDVHLVLNQDGARKVMHRRYSDIEYEVVWVKVQEAARVLSAGADQFGEPARPVAIAQQRVDTGVGSDCGAA